MQEAVNLAAKHNNIYSDSEAGTMTQRWIQGLLSNDQVR